MPVPAICSNAPVAAPRFYHECTRQTHNRIVGAGVILARQGSRSPHFWGRVQTFTFPGIIFKNSKFYLFLADRCVMQGSAIVMK